MGRVNGGYGTWTVATDVSLAAGGAALVAGALWVVFGRSTETVTTRARVELVPTERGAAVIGVF